MFFVNYCNDLTPNKTSEVSGRAFANIVAFVIRLKTSEVWTLLNLKGVGPLTLSIYPVKTVTILVI